MKKWLLILLLFTTSITNAATLVGHVVGVTDGDTITVLDVISRNKCDYTEINATGF